MSHSAWKADHIVKCHLESRSYCMISVGIFKSGSGWMRCRRHALQVPEQRERQHRGERSLLAFWLFSFFLHFCQSYRDKTNGLLSKQLAQGQRKFISAMQYLANCFAKFNHGFLFNNSSFSSACVY